MEPNMRSVSPLELNEVSSPLNKVEEPSVTGSEFNFIVTQITSDYRNLKIKEALFVKFRERGVLPGSEEFSLVKTMNHLSGNDQARLLALLRDYVDISSGLTANDFIDRASGILFPEVTAPNVSSVLTRPHDESLPSNSAMVERNDSVLDIELESELLTAVTDMITGRFSGLVQENILKKLAEKGIPSGSEELYLRKTVMHLSTIERSKFSAIIKSYLHSSTANGMSTNDFINLVSSFLFPDVVEL